MNWKWTTFLYVGLVLHTVKSEEIEKFCRVREFVKPRRVWEHFTGYYCYNYTNNFRLNYKYNFSQSYIGNISIPIVQLESIYFWVDYTNETSKELLRPSFKTDDYFNLFLLCCHEAVICCDDFMTQDNIIGSEEYPCPAIWDGWSCFGPARAGDVQRVVCSKQAYSTQSQVCELKSEKKCFDNGTWNQDTSVGSCATGPVYRNRHNFNIIVLVIATVICFPAVLIFFSFRQFRINLRSVLHRNLILIIMIRNLLTIMSKQIIILDALKTSGSNNVMANNGVACRILAFFENAAKNGMYACMLADGYYLHKLIVRVFADDPKIKFLYCGVVVLTFLPSLIWATKRAANQGSDCWMVDYSQDQWITDGFRIAILIINFILLLDIIRTMIWKLKQGTASHQTRATLRATLFLLPLFGIHIFIISNRNIVPSNKCEDEDIYFYISYLIEGFQGVMVAILFCYINTEVIHELKNVHRKFTLYLQARFDINIGGTKSFKRATMTTGYSN